jgi:hypothetical protein
MAKAFSEKMSLKKKISSHNFSICQQFTAQNSLRPIHREKIKIPLDEFLILVD